MRTMDERLDNLRLWFCATRIRRLLVAITGPIWLSVALVLFTPIWLLALCWEGDPGKLIRWIWTGKGDSNREGGHLS